MMRFVPGKSLFFLALMVASKATANAGSSPFEAMKVAASLDIVAPTNLDSSDENRMGVRSAELYVYGPVDHMFDIVVNLAGHEHEGEFAFELHEGYVQTSKLIPRSRLRAGQFLLNVGRLNRFHQHDWPFVSAPKVHREFLNPGYESIVAAEGASDSGIEYSWLLPTERYWDVTIGVTNGECFGHCETDTGRPYYPTHYIHPVTFFDLGEGRGLQAGASYLGRKDGESRRTELFALDMTYKNRQGKKLLWLVQSELFYQTQSAPLEERSQKAGAYVYTQYGFTEQVSFGVRVDGFSHLNLKEETSRERLRDLDYAVVPTLTYKSSEFSTLRLAYAHEVDTTERSNEVRDRQVQLQFTHILGAHPAHEF